MNRIKQRQTITLEIDLIAYGDGDPQADEIRVNGKSYGVRKLADAMLKSSYYWQWADMAKNAIPIVALWAEDPQGWELAE